MFEKVVRRVPIGTTDHESDLIGLINIIEFELGLGTSGQSVRNRLAGVVSEIGRSDGVASQESVNVLLEVIERLKKVERLLSDSGFETSSETSNG
ncbi:hypothetical protein EOA23_30105 [Mesorhizobium sp. M2A.F.Ca.ET.042.01.1.1]|uniref:hypothetical protein n=1 Tax=Mesorhizobium sp. M2A.F.Ca.ET.042.01.1.1 TaxID=2496745 RepID=UPI000FCA0066|nr:hypothetical protein [Mesorhizobium sp. M2A.F.Ca.ET.042.01.1.1]RUX19651.1 hypothetical protein EOA23_30105 [Mesorhizobium sp. M2A.F.Ca.ET.042.01.1.1]